MGPRLTSGQIIERLVVHHAHIFAAGTMAAVVACEGGRSVEQAHRRKWHCGAPRRERLGQERPPTRSQDAVHLAHRYGAFIKNSEQARDDDGIDRAVGER